MIRMPMVASVVTLAVAANLATAGPHILVSGRWDNTVVVVDLARALDPANDGTPNAVVNRVRVTPDIDARGTGTADTPASGQPVNVVVAADGRTAYVVNHSGRATPAAADAFQHGHAGTVTILDVAKTLDPANQGSLNAVVAIVPTDGFGPVGLGLTPDARYALVTNSEGDGDEDGGRHVAVIDLARRTVVQRVVQAYGAAAAGASCPPTPIPHAGPHASFGCFPDANGLVISPRQGGVAFTANGGTDDVSVIDVRRAVAGDAGAEIARIPVAVGPWGLAVSPDGRWVAVANRENARTGAEGNTVSILDVDKSIAGAKDAEVARVLVGTNNPSVASRPFGVAFTPDGHRIVATNFRSNNISILDVDRLLAAQPAETARIALATPNGAPPRPRGVVVTPDGRYAVITGAPRGASNSSVLWILDLASHTVVGRVTGVGNEAYLLALVP
jgi:DNA-binding beta-propeller fold protein YncE